MAVAGIAQCLAVLLLALQWRQGLSQDACSPENTENFNSNDILTLGRGTVCFQCFFGGSLSSDPATTWRFSDGSSIPPEEGDVTDGVLRIFDTTVTFSSTVTVIVCRLEGEGQYDLGFTVSVAPEYTEDPGDQVVREGNGFSLSIALDPGNPEAVDFQWQFNGINISSDTRITLTRDSITITGVQRSENGTYSVTTYNTVGPTTVDFDLDVQYPPVFTADGICGLMVTDVRLAGTDFTLNCQVSGNPAPRLITTQPDTSSVPFANEQFSFISARIEDTGTYTCTATNTVDGTEESCIRTFMVTVGTAPPSVTGLNVTVDNDNNIVISWFFQDSVELPILIFSVVITDSAGIQVFRDNVMVPSGNVASISFGIEENLEFDTDYNVSVTATNAFGVSDPEITTFTTPAPVVCIAEFMDTVFGSYSWPETTVGDTVALPCVLGSVLMDGSEANATRTCGEGGVWMDPDFSQCADTFDLLEDMNITSESYEEAISLTRDSVETASASPDDQTEDNIEAVSGALQDTAELLVADQTLVVEVQTVNETVEILDILQEWNATVVATESANIVQAFESIVSSYTLQENFTELVVEGENLAFVVERLEVQTLIESGRGFSLAENDTMNVNTGGGAENFTVLASDELATAFLPPSLFALLGSTDDVGVFFSLYQTAVLFPLGGEAQVVGPGGADRMVGSQVVAATVAGQDEVRDLSDPVTILIRLNNLDTAGNITAITCVSYNFNAADGRGNWTSEGCVTEMIDDGDGVLDDEDIVRCSCNHLTNFAVLTDVCSRTGGCEISSEAQLALDVISIIGVVLSLLGIIITIITLLVFKKLRQRDATKYHIQLCIALFCMLLVFVIGIDQTDVSEGCVTVSVLIHYFTLVAVMWMGAEAVLLFQKLVIVFVQITTRYIVILSLVCWLVPIIPAVIPAAIDWEDVVSFTDSGDVDFCFIGDTAVFFGAFLGPILAVVAFNSVIFCIVVFVLIRHALNTSLRLQGEKKIDIKTAIRLLISITGVMFLFGLTWVFGALTVAEASLAFQILFALFNSFQGFFIFLFFVVFSKDSREAWMEVLSCGRYTPTTLHPSRTPVLKTESSTATAKSTTQAGASNLSRSEVPYAELAALEPGSSSTFGKSSTEKETKTDGVDGVKTDPELEPEKGKKEALEEREVLQQAGEALGLQVGRESPGLKARVQRYSTKRVGKHHVEIYEVDFEVGDDDDDPQCSPSIKHVIQNINA